MNNQVETAYLAMGCFWGAEKLFRSLPGVIETTVGYQGGHVENPSYQAVCTGSTGHAETVRIRFAPDAISFTELLRIFVENHDPTQGERQGNDVGPQYRSAIFTASDEQVASAYTVLEAYQTRLSEAGYGPITTEVSPAGPFYEAEEYHQRYLEKNPGGYCPIHATGVTCGA